MSEFPFSAFVSKTVTVEPREGNPPPRLWELAGGLINSIGLPNKGLDGFLHQDLPGLVELPVPLIVNVMGFTRDEVATLVDAFAQQEEVAALELNVSCPNVETGLVMGADPEETGRLLEHVRPLTDKPLIVKLTPNATDVRGGRPRCAGWGRQRPVADQHDSRNGSRSSHGFAVAWRRDRRRVRAGGPSGGAGTGPRDRAGGRDPDCGDGRRPVRSRRARLASSGRETGRRRD